MIIVGAKGFAKEVLEVLHQLHMSDGVFFFDNVTPNPPSLVYGVFDVLTTFDQVLNMVSKVGSKRFTLGVGGPKVRYELFGKFEKLGLELTSTISPYARIGSFGVEIDQGVNLMTGSVLTNSIRVGRGVLINLNCTIGHDSELKQFVELSPGVHISGNCTIEEFVSIGTNAVVLPGVTVGANSIIGAGSVVTKSVPKNSLVVGVPGKVIRKLN